VILVFPNVTTYVEFFSNLSNISGASPIFQKISADSLSFITMVQNIMWQSDAVKKTFSDRMFFHIKSQ
jgi:hypothetical protein